MPSLPFNDVIAPSRVQVLVDPPGNVVSAVLLPSNNPLEALGRAEIADTNALAIARSLRFAPAAAAHARRNNFQLAHRPRDFHQPAGETMKSPPQKILVIDVGGTHVKFHVPGLGKVVKINSGHATTAAQMAAAVKNISAGWQYDAVTIGYPGPVKNNRPLREPHNLGGGWVKFNYQKAFGRPVHIINDAAMQALGGHTGGRMLFLGLGTGLGSALVVGDTVLPLELAHLPYKKNRSYEEYLGTAGLKRLGKKKWQRHVAEVVRLLKNALLVDYVVLGGGNARLVEKFPPGVRRGKNSNAIRGGRRLWHQP